MRGAWIALVIYFLLWALLPDIYVAKTLTFFGWLAGLGVFAAGGWYLEWKLDEWWTSRD